MTTSIYQHLVTAARLVGANFSFAQSALRRHSSWLIAVGYATLAATWNHSFFADTWWLVYLPVWTVALRQKPSGTDRPLGPIMILSAIMLFAWLFFNTQSAVYEALATWEFKSESLSLLRLSFLIQVTLCSLLGALLLATPLRRIVGSRLEAVSVFVGLPYAVVAGHPLFSIARWSQHTVANSFLLFDFLMPILILAWACSDQNPIPIFLETSVERVKSARPLRSLLRGDLNVAVNFFGIFAPALALQIFAMYQTEDLSAQLFTSWPGYALQALLFIIPFVIFVVGVVSSWSSLARFKKRNIIAANVAELGQILVIITALPILSYCILVDIPNAALAARDGIRLVPGRDWSVVVDGNLLRISGAFTPGIGDAVKAAVNRDPALRVVVLDSPGGNIGEGLQIARVIKDHALATAVKNRCSSACTFAFVAGRERILLPNTRLGFHSCRQMIWYSECTNERYEAYFVDNGIERGFIRKGLAVPWKTIWYPTVDELIAANVVTRTTKPTFENTPADLRATTANSTSKPSRSQ